MKLAEIKKHNQNVENVVNFLNQENDVVYDKKAFGYINSVFDIFSAEKNLVKGYNEMVSRYNANIWIANKTNLDICDNLSMIKAYKKRLNDLKEQSIKLNKVFESVEKPKNYKLCLSLRNLKEKCLIDLNATKEETVLITKTRTYTTKHLVGRVVRHRTHTETYNEPITQIFPDKEKRKKAEEKIKIVEEKIKNQPDYEKCLMIEKLEFDKNTLKETIKELNTIIYKTKNENDNLFEIKNKNELFLKKFEQIIDYQRNLVKSNINKRKLEKMKLEKIENLRPIEQEEIPENMISHYIYQNGYCGDTCSLINWKKRVNSYIDYFVIKNVEKNKIKKTDKDYKDYYIEQYDDYAECLPEERYDDFIK